VPQPVVIHHILVAEGNAEHSLAEQRRDPVLDPVVRAPVTEAAGEPLYQPDRFVGGPEQQRPGIRRHRAAVERRHHPATFDGSKIEHWRATLCRHRGTPLLRAKSLLQKTYHRFGAPTHLPFVRNPG
jgi:hypothetical protein